MIRAALPAILAVAAFAVSAHAAETAQPIPGKAHDPRLVEHRYDPNEVVAIPGRPNVQATIAFAEDEHIENVAIGDSNSWQVTPNKRANLLFVKPLDKDAATNMTVVTDQHTYYFDLIARPSAQALYELHFTYPDQPKQPQLAQAASTTEMAAATDPYSVVDPAQLNFKWASQGAAKLLPAKTFDDGEATFLSWEAKRPIPAILIKDAKGVEGPVNYAVRGDTIVIEGVPRQIVLRSGDDVATLTNQAPVREAPGKGAAVALNGEKN